MNKKTNKIVALGLGGLLVLGTGGALGALLIPREVPGPVQTVVQVQDASAEQLQAAFADGVASVEPVVQIQTVTETKTVQSEDLPTVLEYIYNENGNIEYLLSDLDDNEIGLIVDRIVMVNDFKSLAIQGVQKDLFKELDDEIVGDITLDKKDMEKLRLNDNADEITVDDIDFNDQDATLVITGVFKQDDSKFDFEAEVSIRDGEYDDLSVTSVTLQ